jgi:glycerophosphoryl diester phosphodiesterase
MVDREISVHAGRRASRLRLLLLVVPVLAAAWYLVAWLRHVPADGPVAAIAHRGGPTTSGTPENTLAAFRAAIDSGADWLELDVRSTRDGVLVALHDASVDRTTDGSGLIAELTFEEARALDAGAGERIPTVQEVIELAKASGASILPEIKDGPRHPAVAPALVDLLRSEGFEDRTIIQAFDAETLVTLRELAPGIRTCWLTGLGQLDLADPPADAPYVCPMGEMLLLNPDAVRGAHEAGRRVLAWWLAAESPATNRILEAYGVDGLIVDDLRSVTGR